MSDYEDHQWSSGDMICHTLERETCHWLVLCFNQQSSFCSHSKCPFKSVKSHSWFHGEKNLGHKKEAKQQFSFLKLFFVPSKTSKPQNPSYPPANAAKPTSSFQLFSSQLRFPNKTQHSSYYLILCTSKVHSSAEEDTDVSTSPLELQQNLDDGLIDGCSWWLNWTGKYDHQIGSFPTPNSWKLPRKKRMASRVKGEVGLGWLSWTVEMTNKNHLWSCLNRKFSNRGTMSPTLTYNFLCFKNHTAQHPFFWKWIKWYMKICNHGKSANFFVENAKGSRL